jgi:hypothetical protein
MAGRVVVSTLNDDTGILATQNGMTGIAKAWVNFNGTTGVRNSSFNVGSITINGTGDYTLNFTTVFANANYCWAGIAYEGSAPANFNFPSIGARQASAVNAGSLRIATAYQQSAGATNFSNVYVQVFSL